MAGYLVALDGVGAQALKTTAMAIIQGELEDMSAKVAPTPPELSRAVRKRMAEDRKRELASSAAIDYTPTPFMGIEMRRHAAKAKMFDEGRQLLMECDSHAHATEIARRRKVPPHSVYSGILGAFYSPPYYQPPTEDYDHGNRQPSETTEVYRPPGIPEEPGPALDGLPADDTGHSATNDKAPGTIAGVSDDYGGSTGHSGETGTDQT